MERERQQSRQPSAGGRARRPVLWGHVLYLSVAGLWARGRGALYLAYAALVQLCAAAYVAVGVASVLTARGDVDAISHTLMHTLEVVCGMLKAGLFFGKRRRFYRLVRDLDAMASSDRGQLELRGARRRARRLSVALSTYIYCLILLWLPAPLLAVLAGGGQWLLPVVQLHGVDWSRRPAAYGALYALQCAVLLTQVPVVIGLDCFFAAAALHVAALLQLLGRRLTALRRCGRDGDEARAEVEAGAEAEAETSDGSCRERRRAVYAQLCDCIRTHQKITKLVRDLEAAMGAMVVVQFSSNVVGLCMTLYQQTQIKDALTALQYALILPFYSGQLYFYCWTADAITEQGEALSMAAYSSSWVGASAGFQRALSVLMARAHKPLLITAGRLYPINTATFVALVKASYSYYTLLRQLGDAP